MNKHTATKTAPVTQKVKIIVSSMFPQLEATGVHHQGLQKWKIIDHYIHRVGYTVIERVDRIKSHRE